MISPPVVSSISTTTALLPISLASDVISVAPVDFSLVTSSPHTVVITLTDACKATFTSTMSVTATNTPPYFTVAGYSDMIVPMNSIYTFKMSDFSDAEGHTAYLSL